MSISKMVEIFKTDVPDVAAAESVRTQLLHSFPGSRISFDLEDRDKVMKIVPERSMLLPEQIMVLVKQLGYNIEPLD